jgi:FAD dependent oxidoreductase
MMNFSKLKPTRAVTMLPVFTRYYYRIPVSRPSTASPARIMATSGSHSHSFSQSVPKHIVVCGGGVIGACTAYFLSQYPQTTVTVVEKSAPACAASGKAGGFLALDWCDGGPLSGLARASFKLHKSLAEKFNGEEAYGYRALTTLSVPVLSERVVSSSLRGSNLLPDWVDGETARPAKQIGTTETTAQVLKKNELGIPSVIAGLAN